MYYKDIGLIIGKRGTGKSFLAKKLAKDLSIEYIYVNYFVSDNEYLEELYNKNKDKKTVIIFDNYFYYGKNIKIDKMFVHNKNFTIIYVMDYIVTHMIKIADILYISKESDYETIQHYHNRLKDNFKKFCSLDWLTNAMEELKDYGFVCFDKNNRLRNYEKYMYF